MKPTDHPPRPEIGTFNKSSLPNWNFGTSDGELTKYFWTLRIDHLKLPRLTPNKLELTVGNVQNCLIEIFDIAETSL